MRVVIWWCGITGWWWAAALREKKKGLLPNKRTTMALNDTRRRYILWYGVLSYGTETNCSTDWLWMKCEIAVGSRGSTASQHTVQGSHVSAGMYVESCVLWFKYRRVSVRGGGRMNIRVSWRFSHLPHRVKRDCVSGSYWYLFYRYRKRKEFIAWSI